MVSCDDRETATSSDDWGKVTYFEPAEGIAVFGVGRVMCFYCALMKAISGDKAKVIGNTRTMLTVAGDGACFF